MQKHPIVKIQATGFPPPIILDWRKIKGSEHLSTVSSMSINGTAVKNPVATVSGSDSEHLVFRDGVVSGENVIKLDFTSPILTSGSAITRYVDKEDGAEYIYSLFVPSDASTAFPVFDQPDLKARFQLIVDAPKEWKVISNTDLSVLLEGRTGSIFGLKKFVNRGHVFAETNPISTYVFAFAAGDFSEFSEKTEEEIIKALDKEKRFRNEVNIEGQTFIMDSEIRNENSKTYVRKSQAAKFKPHAAEVFRLNREGIKYLETYFDYKFPFPKYDLVLIPEFPFGGMEHAGATFLRESAVIFPQEPTKNDYISRANVIFHEAAHQWFGDTVTMKWFDDLWLKEGFAEFMAYKTLEKVMPEYNAWKVFYERNKQAAYLTDSTRGTTPIYQEIANLNAAKSAYGNIVYRKAPSFLKQAEFLLGEDKFQTAVRSFLKKYEFRNAEWNDLVSEFEATSQYNLKNWANGWVKQRGLPIVRLDKDLISQKDALGTNSLWTQKFQIYQYEKNQNPELKNYSIIEPFTLGNAIQEFKTRPKSDVFFPNYNDYGYGIFLLDAKSRDYVIQNIHSEENDFLRTMMWGSLWDSVREAELDPKEYVELVLKVQSAGFSPSERDKSRTLNAGETDESTIQTLLGRVSTAMTYYMSVPPAVAGGLSRQTRSDNKKGSIKSENANNQLQPPATAGGTDSGLASNIESMLIDRMQKAPTLGQRITYYRAFLNLASTENARNVLKRMLKSNAAVPGAVPEASGRRVSAGRQHDSQRDGGVTSIPLKTKDRFDIVTKLLILGDADAPKLLADLEKTETSDEAKRYAYAARAGIATAENKAKYWIDFTNNKTISESWIEAAFGPFNSVRHADLTLPYLEKALNELPNHKRNRKIFFVNGWLAAFIGGQRSEQALGIVNKFLADNPKLDKDLRLKILENVDLIERAVKIRMKFKDR